MGGVEEQCAFDREVEVLASVQGHQQFVQMLHAATTATTTYVFLSRAWGDLGRYVDVLGRLPEDVAKHIFHQILEFCWLPRVVVADLGLACTVRPPTYALDSWAGTVAYMAPEVMRAHPHWVDIAGRAAEGRAELVRELAGPAFARDKNAKASDMWSLGITLAAAV
ncbi:kinase-like domain-containing protein [Syncephalis pseudoplumigaleata]|uniref:non-specific serine/threonine protein kinase n=1 Tax=Syncephalis pseudoplumigaleata TaxID=1712513 RepID=A0A4P9YR41_9FUNG|nr:kinase-like domain-containing protein [Syncephalis pseudoplumigaleata]|eukprot:RKP22306.1 kinase-like domain-containing protein [Syncephalis pseudoplumigaleata]